MQQEVISQLCFWEQSSGGGTAGGGRGPYLLDLCLQVTQLHALLQVLAVLLRCHVQLLLLLVQELQQVLHASGHVHVPVAEQLHTCSRDAPLGMTHKASQDKQPVSTVLHLIS